METKTYRAALEFKEEDQGKGQFEAVFATMNVMDHDGDVTVPGAFGEQRVVIEPWNHNWESPPVGKGVIAERENEAVVGGRFFLSTDAGKEHYEVARELGPDQEFSYTFNIIEAEQGQFEGRDARFLKKLEVLGVGQVTKGAGIATRLTSLKRKKEQDEGEAEDTRPDGETPEVSDDGKPSDDLLARIALTEASVIRQRSL